MDASPLNITLDVTSTKWADLRRFVRLADALGVHGEDFVQVTLCDDGCAGVHELRIVGDQVTRDE